MISPLISAEKVNLVFDVLKDAARYRKPCPTNEAIAKRLGMNHNRVSIAIGVLTNAGRIVVDRASTERRVRVGGYQSGWSAPRRSGGWSTGSAQHAIRYDCREYEQALRASGGRFENANTRGERLDAMPKSPPLNHSPIGCSAATAAGL